MELAARVLFWFSFALYVGATVLYAYQFILRRQKVAWWARFLVGAGFICQTLSIGAHSMVTHGTQFTGGNQLVLASWALVLLYFVMEHVIKIHAYGAFLIPVAVVLLFAAQIVGWEGAVKLPAAEAALITGAGVAFHVALIVFANAGFAVGSVSSALYLYQRGQLKSHKTSVLSRRLPSLATLQVVARRSIGLAFPVYTAGLSLGVVRAIQTNVGGWWIDPRIMTSGLVLVTYAVYLFLIYRHDVSARTTAWISQLGFALVIILAILARTVPAGFHIFGL